MEKKMETTTMGSIGFKFQGIEGLDKEMETTIMGNIGTTIGMHSFIPS